MERNGYKHAVQRARVLVVDDHLVFADRCRRLLEPEFNVVGVESDGCEIGRSVVKLRPEVVIIDLCMGEMSGFDIGDKVKAAMPEARLVYMTMASDWNLAEESFRRGAQGYVLKPEFPEGLRVAVRRAIRGECFLSALLAKQRTRGSLSRATLCGTPC